MQNLDSKKKEMLENNNYKIIDDKFYLMIKEIY